MRLTYKYDVAMTINKTYYIKPGMNGKVLTVEARGLRARIQEDTREQINNKVIPEVLDEDDELIVEIEFIKEWYTQEGKPKIQDLDNRIKFFIDSVFKEIGVDDSRIFKLIATKREIAEDELEHATITIRKVNEE